MDPGGAAALPLCGDALYALVNPIVLEGRVSWYPRDVRGVAPVNCYVLREDDEAMLVDTGVTAHRSSLLHQLASVVGLNLPLRIMHTRLGEYGSVCNTMAVLQRFPVHTVYGTFPADEWVDFEPSADPSTRRARLWEGVQRPILGPVQIVELGHNRRRVHIVSSPLRLLPAHWLYDERTRALLTADSFSFIFRPGRDGPWCVNADDDPATLATLRAHLRAERYWWLDEARTEPIRQGLAALLRHWPIDRICPAYGCIIEGPAAVARHLALLHQALAPETEAS